MEQKIKDERSARRHFLMAISAIGSATAVSGYASVSFGARPKIVVVGGGFGGATVARYLMLWGRGSVDVTLVERNLQFTSCPMSNLVIAGYSKIGDITITYDRLRSLGIKIIHGEVTAVAHEKQLVRLTDGSELPYDRLIVSPGIDFIWDQVGGMDGQAAQEAIPSAWKTGAQTVMLRNQLTAMTDGGVFAISIPVAPYRCTPAPYERACLVADYLKKYKPKSKVLIFDANEDVGSMKELFTKVWKERYGNIIEYQNNSELKAVHVPTRTAILEFDQVKVNVLNVIPPQRAGEIAGQAGLIDVNKRWCDVNWLTMESKSVSKIHVLGDAVFPSARMPKSGHVANQQAKLAAAAILNIFGGLDPNRNPLITSTCYSYVSEREGIHVSSVHTYDQAAQTMQVVAGAGGVSMTPSELEGNFAAEWALNIWADSFG